ncbi:hypothetical protein [Pandoravirus japonicus]|uniref:Uncharacterized protein n=1 Tax=Pandoravirus japonicus TaxID=2823154 RepID=A0A811BPG0_9VIRU|nr:hypothetical protein [Pandoravirus japonicus]
MKTQEKQKGKNTHVAPLLSGLGVGFLVPVWLCLLLPQHNIEVVTWAACLPLWLGLARASRCGAVRCAPKACARGQCLRVLTGHTRLTGCSVFD